MRVSALRLLFSSPVIVFNHVLVLLWRVVVLTDHLSRPENRPSTGHKGEGAGLHSGTSAVMFLEVSRIEVCKSACVFHFADRYGVLAQLRAVVRAAAEDERLRSAEEELGLPAESLSSHVSIPNIVHSTFARYDHITFSSTDEEDEFRSELLDLCAGWEPRSVGVDSFHLVHEYHPYMQVQKLWRPEKGRVTTSPIIATYRLQDLMELTATTTATTTMVTTEMDTADTSRVEDSSKPSTSPCRDPTDTGEDNELTLTPLSPMYHQYIHPSEERRLRGDAEDSGTPFKLSSDLGDGEMLLTPLSEQLGSAGGSAASAMGAITQGAGDEDDGSHLVRSLADGALFSPTIGSPPPAKGQPRSKVPVVTTVDADADAGHTGKKLPIKGAVPRRTWVSVLGSCVGAGAFVVTVGGAAYWCNTHREEVRKLLQQWATHFTGLFTAFNTKKLT